MTSLNISQKSAQITQLSDNFETVLCQHGQKIGVHCYQIPLVNGKLSLNISALSAKSKQQLLRMMASSKRTKCSDSKIEANLVGAQKSSIIVTCYYTEKGTIGALTLKSGESLKESLWAEDSNVISLNCNKYDPEKPTYITVGTPKQLSDITSYNLFCFPSIKSIQEYCKLKNYFENLQSTPSDITVLLNRAYFYSSDDLFDIQASLVMPSKSWKVLVSKGDLSINEGFSKDNKLILDNYYQVSDKLKSQYLNKAIKYTQEELSEHLLAQFDVKELAMASGCDVSEFKKLSQLPLLKPEKEAFPFILDCSPTGTGKSNDLMVQLEKYLDGKPSIFSKKHRIILVVPNFNNVPAKLLLREDVVLSRGRQPEDFAIVQVGEGTSFKRVSQVTAQEKILDIFPANCSEELREAHSHKQRGSCSVCGRAKNVCEYETHLKEAKEGFPSKRVIITTLGNCHNLFDKLLPKSGERFHIIEDDLNFINDSHQITISSSDKWFRELISLQHTYGFNLEHDVFQSTIEVICQILSENKFQITQEAYLRNSQVTIPKITDIDSSIITDGDSISFEQAQKLLTTKPNSNKESVLYHNDSVSVIRRIRDNVLSRLIVHYPLITNQYFCGLDWGRLQKACKQYWQVFKLLEAIYHPEYENLASSQLVSSSIGLYRFSSKIKLKSRLNSICLGESEEGIIEIPVFANINESKLTINLSKTTPKRYQTFAASLLRLSADDFFESYHTVGKLPSKVVYRPSNFKPTYIRCKNNNYESSFDTLPPNASFRYINKLSEEELKLKTDILAFSVPSIRIPSHLKHAIFDVKQVKDKISGISKNELGSNVIFKQYFGDEVGSNELFNSGVNCITLRSSRAQNISSLLIFQGRDTGTFVRKIKVNFGTEDRPNIKTIPFVNGGINLVRQNIMLNQAYGRLRANRLNESLAFISEDEFVNLSYSNVIDIDLETSSKFDIQLHMGKVEISQSDLKDEFNTYAALAAIEACGESDSYFWKDWVELFKKAGGSSGYREFTKLFEDYIDLSKKRIQINKKDLLTATLKICSYYLVWHQRHSLELQMLVTNLPRNGQRIFETLLKYSDHLNLVLKVEESKFKQWYPEVYSEEHLGANQDNTSKFKAPKELVTLDHLVIEDAVPVKNWKYLENQEFFLSEDLILN